MNYTNNNFTVHRFHQVPLTQTERQVGNHRAITEQPPVVRENCVVVGGFCYCCLLLSEMRWKVFISPKSFLWLFLSLADCHKCQCLHGRQQLVCKLLPTTCGAVEKLQKLWHKPETENTRLTTVPHCSGQDMLNFYFEGKCLTSSLCRQVCIFHAIYGRMWQSATSAI